MWREAKYLKEISRSLSELHQLQKRKEQPLLRNKVNWLRIANILALIVIFLSAPYLLNLLYGSAEHYAGKAPNHEVTLGVDKLIRQVQSEILKSEREREEKNIAPMFQLKSFELEISFVAKRVSTQAGSAKFEIVTVDTQLQTGAEQTHRLKLFLDVATSYEGSTQGGDPQTPTEEDNEMGLAPGMPDPVSAKKGQNR